MRTLLLILGAANYPSWKELALSAFPSSYQAFKSAMLDGPLSVACTEDCLDLFDSADTWPVQLRQIRDWLKAKEAEPERADDLLIYYVGHGGIGLGGEEVYLAINSSHPDDPFYTSIPRGSLANLLRGAAATFRKYLLIDCCFAAAVVEKLQGGALGDKLSIELREVGKVAVEKPDSGGLAALCASSSIASASAAGRDGLTQFTDGLLSALEAGDSKTNDLISFESLRRLIWDQLSARYGSDAVAPASYFPDNMYSPIHQNPMFPNRAERRLLNRTRSSERSSARDLELFEKLRQIEAKVAATFEEHKTRSVPTSVLQRLAQPIEREAVRLQNLDIVDEFLGRDSKGSSLDAAIFTAAVMIYKLQDESYFDSLVKLASEERRIRGAPMWRVLRAIKRLLPSVDLTRDQRNRLINALAYCSRDFDSKAGLRFKTRDIVLMVAQIATIKKLRIDLLQDGVFSAQQNDEWLAFKKEDTPRPALGTASKVTLTGTPLNHLDIRWVLSNVPEEIGTIFIVGEAMVDTTFLSDDEMSRLPEDITNRIHAGLAIDDMLRPLLHAIASNVPIASLYSENVDETLEDFGSERWVENGGSNVSYLGPNVEVLFPLNMKGTAVLSLGKRIDDEFDEPPSSFQEDFPKAYGLTRHAFEATASLSNGSLVFHWSYSEGSIERASERAPGSKVFAAFPDVFSFSVVDRTLSRWDYLRHVEDGLRSRRDARTEDGGGSPWAADSILEISVNGMPKPRYIYRVVEAGKFEHAPDRGHYDEPEVLYRYTRYDCQLVEFA
jgi:hypothetical protein